MSESKKGQYEARIKRFHDAVSLNTPDRVPIASVSAYFFYKYSGLTFKDAMYHYERAASGVKASVKKLQWDMAPSVAMNPGPVMEILGLKQFRWPGHDLPEDYNFQFIEGEYMGEDEYDELLSNPEGFTIRKLLPRISGLMEPLEVLPPAHWLSSGSSLLRIVGNLAGDPSFSKILEALQRVGEEMNRYSRVRKKLVEELKEEGFPMMAGAGGKRTL